MVVLGLVGEFVGDAGVYVCSSRLQIIEGATLRALDSKATEAGRKAAGAIVTADGAILRSGKAETASSAAIDKSGRASTIAADALSLASGARKSAAETARLFEARTLTKEQQDRIAGKLKQFHGVPIDVFVYADEDPWSHREAIAFGESVLSALEQSMDAQGWVSMGGAPACPPWPVVGLAVGAPDNCSNCLSLGEVLRALRDEAISMYPFASPIDRPNCGLLSSLGAPSPWRGRYAPISIIIGKKPNPLIGQDPLGILRPRATRK